VNSADVWTEQAGSKLADHLPVRIDVDSRDGLGVPRPPCEIEAPTAHPRAGRERLPISRSKGNADKSTTLTVRYRWSVAGSLSAIRLHSANSTGSGRTAAAGELSYATAADRYICFQSAPFPHVDRFRTCPEIGRTHGP
jgi:hypothetical protein